MSRDQMTTRTGRSGAFDVIVVGAGLSGLAAALRLRDHGRRVLVLEADARVGGRTETGHFADGQWIELGGQWVAEDHTELRRLIARFGLRLVPMAAEGRVVSIHGGRRDEGRSSSAPALPPPAARDLNRALARLGRIVESVDLAEPWLTADADRLDRQTFDSWIREELATEAARRYFRAAHGAIFAPDPVEVSTLHAAVYLRSGGHLHHLAGVDRAAQEHRVHGGAGAISAAIAEHLGAVVRVSMPVRTIADDDESVSVTTRDGAIFRAGRVLVTLPPPLAGRLEYIPPLPSARDQLTQRAHSISVTKMHLVYETPFWRARGLSGEGVSDVGPVAVVLDNTPPGSPRGVLVGFIEGADKREWALHTAEERRGAFIGAAVRFFGPDAAHPIEYLERDWSAQEFTRGCYHGHFAPSTWTTYGAALTDPVGRIHWAGTETAREWTGYMEGAVRSGNRAADEIAPLLD